jgi:hypothetical protein
MTRYNPLNTIVLEEIFASIVREGFFSRIFYLYLCSCVPAASVYYHCLLVTEYSLVDFKGFRRWCVKLGITGFWTSSIIWCSE